MTVDVTWYRSITWGTSPDKPPEVLNDRGYRVPIEWEGLC
jgi:hypothetical protein